MERLGQLDPRLSVLDTEFDETALEAEAGEAAQQVSECEGRRVGMGSGSEGQHWYCCQDCFR